MSKEKEEGVESYQMIKSNLLLLTIGETATKAEFQPWYNMTPEASGKVVKGRE